MNKTIRLNGASVKVVEATSNGKRVLWTMQLRYQRFIHSELMTHRVLSRSASSSRAIPVRKILAQVWNDPARPRHWGQNRPGMQASSQLSGWRRKLAKGIWKAAGRGMCVAVWVLDKIGLHKQVANRLLEPWQYINVIVTATEWDNFFALRNHEDAQPEFQDLARCILAAQNEYRREGKIRVATAQDAWHLPYVTDDERWSFGIKDLLKMSAARRARVSYLTHDGKVPDPAKDFELHDKLVESKPEHASPTEHQAWYVPHSDAFFYNLQGWKSYRWQRDHVVL